MASILSMIIQRTQYFLTTFGAMPPLLLGAISHHAGKMKPVKSHYICGQWGTPSFESPLKTSRRGLIAALVQTGEREKEKRPHFFSGSGSRLLLTKAALVLRQRFDNSKTNRKVMPWSKTSQIHCISYCALGGVVWKVLSAASSAALNHSGVSLYNKRLENC